MCRRRIGAVAALVGLAVAGLIVAACDPSIQLGGKLVGGPIENGAGQLGFSVALSADGKTALVGAPQEGFGAGAQGAAWVFVRDNTNVATQVELTPAFSGAGSFATSVALSTDGNTALVGDPTENGGAGAVWVYTRTGDVWGPGTKIAGPAGTGFGTSVALSAAGTTALIGGPNAGSHAGAAWVYTTDGGNVWAPQVVFAVRPGTSTLLGTSVALSSSGNTALIGEPGAGSGAGAVSVYTRSGTDWSGPTVITGTGAGETGAGQFGASVSLAATGTRALIGAPTDSRRRRRGLGLHARR